MLGILSVNIFLYRHKRDFLQKHQEDRNVGFITGRLNADIFGNLSYSEAKEKRRSHCILDMVIIFFFTH